MSRIFDLPDATFAAPSTIDYMHEHPGAKDVASYESKLNFAYMDAEGVVEVMQYDLVTPCKSAAVSDWDLSNRWRRYFLQEFRVIRATAKKSARVHVIEEATYCLHSFGYDCTKENRVNASQDVLLKTFSKCLEDSRHGRSTGCSAALLMGPEPSLQMFWLGECDLTVYRTLLNNRARHAIHHIQRIRGLAAEQHR